MIRCSRCNRRYRNQPDWNCEFKQGEIIAHICPDCQTPEENAEAEINLATSIYVKGLDGKHYKLPKFVSA